MSFVVRHFAISSLVLTLVAGATFAQQATVTIRKRSGELEANENVRVTKDTYKAVGARRGPATYEWGAGQVVSVRFNAEPRDYKQGISLLEDGDLAGAVPLFRASLGQARRYKWVQTYANYHLARALRGLGDFGGATQSLQALIAADATHRLVPSAYEMLGDMALSRGKAPEAKAHYQRLQKLVKDKGLDADFDLAARRGLATAEARFGNANKGKDLLEGLLRDARGNKREENLVRLEIGGLFNRMKAYDQAETYFSQIIDRLDKKSPDPLLLSGACNGLGDSQYYRQQHDKALFTYSRVYGLFFDRSELAAQVSHAMYFGGKAFQLQAGRESDAEKKAEYSKRAKKLLRRAAGAEYAGTPGNARARKDLGM